MGCQYRLQSSDTPNNRAMLGPPGIAGRFVPGQCSKVAPLFGGATRMASLRLDWFRRVQSGLKLRLIIIANKLLQTQ